MSDPKKLKLYALMHVDTDNNINPNLKSKGADSINVYLRCARTLAHSLALQGVEFCLLTNDLRIATPEYRKDVQVEEITFTLKIQKGIRFFSAHFKLDVMKQFALGKYGDLVGLIDLDMVLCHTLPIEALVTEATSSILAFDISHEVMPSYGADRVRQDMERLTGMKLRNPRWYGGEFLIATPERFREISDETSRVWSCYHENMSEFRHIGMETVVSAALNAIVERGGRISDAGKPGFVSRWWSSRTVHDQVPFSNVMNRSFLHLPSDKEFLSQYTSRTFGNEFIKSYIKYLEPRLFRMGIYQRMLNMFTSREPKYAPRVSA